MTKQATTSEIISAMMDASRTQLTLLGQLAEALEPKGPKMLTITEPPKVAKTAKTKGLALPKGFKLSPYKTSRKNTPVYVLTGDTKPIKDQLKALGCKWVRAKLGWTVLDTEIDAVRKIIG